MDFTNYKTIILIIFGSFKVKEELAVLACGGSHDSCSPPGWGSWLVSLRFKKLKQNQTNKTIGPEAHFSYIFCFGIILFFPFWHILKFF